MIFTAIDRGTPARSRFRTAVRRRSWKIRSGQPAFSHARFHAVSLDDVLPAAVKHPGNDAVVRPLLEVRAAAPLLQQIRAPCHDVLDSSYRKQDAGARGFRQACAAEGPPAAVFRIGDTIATFPIYCSTVDRSLAMASSH